MICEVCQCSLDSCCSNFICCTCAKKQFNQKQRVNTNSNRRLFRDNVSQQTKSNLEVCHQCNSCGKISPEPDCDCGSIKITTSNDQSIIYRQSKMVSSTTGQTLMTKVTLPIVPNEKCESSEYLIEWNAEVGTTDMNPGQARVAVNLTKLPVNSTNTPMALIDTKLGVQKDYWTPYSGSTKIVLDSSAIIELSYASSADPNTKNICIRNASISAIKID